MSDLPQFRSFLAEPEQDPLREAFPDAQLCPHGRVTGLFAVAYRESDRLIAEAFNLDEMPTLASAPMVPWCCATSPTPETTSTDDAPAR